MDLEIIRGVIAVYLIGTAIVLYLCKTSKLDPAPSALFTFFWPVIAAFILLAIVLFLILALVAVIIIIIQTFNTSNEGGVGK